MRRCFSSPSPVIASPDPAPRPRRRRVVALAAGLGAALFAALVLRPAPPAAAPLPPAPAVPTAEQTLAKIPAPAGASATDQALGIALGKVREKPAEATGWVNLGDALAQEQRDTASEKFYDHAEAAYASALRLNPRSVDAMTGLAWVTGGRHLFDQSQDWANRALALDAENAAAHGLLGDAAVELGDYEAAYEHYQKMMDAKPDLSSWSRGAHLLWLTGDSKKAAWLMEKALKAGAPFAENTAWCRAKLALMLFQQGSLISAAQVLEPPLRAATKNTHVLLAAGRIAAAREDFPAAEKYFQTVLAEGPNHDALAALGDLRAAQGDPAAAEEFYVKVEALDAAQVAQAGHSHAGMARFYADHDRHLIEALRLAEARKLTRNVHEADTLAWVYYKSGDQPRAIEAIKRALSQHTQDAEIHFHAGMIAAKFGDRVSAQNHLQQALSLNPHFSLLQAPIAVATLAQLGSQPQTTAAVEAATPP